MSKDLETLADKKILLESYATGKLAQNPNVFLDVFKTIDHELRKKIWFDIINQNHTEIRFDLIAGILRQNKDLPHEKYYSLSWTDEHQQTALQIILRQLLADIDPAANLILAYKLIEQGSNLDFIDDSLIESLRIIDSELLEFIGSIRQNKENIRQAKEGNFTNWEELKPWHQSEIWCHLLENNNAGVNCDKICQIISLYEGREIDENHPLSWGIFKRYNPLEATVQLALLPNSLEKKRNLIALAKLIISYGVTEISPSTQAQIQHDEVLVEENFDEFLQHYQTINLLRRREDPMLNYSLFADNLEQQAQAYYTNLSPEDIWQYATPEIGLKNIKLKILKHSQQVLNMLSSFLDKCDDPDNDYKMPSGYFFGAISEIFTSNKIIDGQLYHEELLTEEEKNAVSIFSYNPDSLDYWYDIVDIAGSGPALMAIRSWVEEKIDQLTLELDSHIEHSSDDVSIISASTQDPINLSHYCEIFLNNNEEIITPQQMQELWLAAVNQVLTPISEEQFEECQYLITKIIRNCHDLQNQEQSPLFWQNEDGRTALELLVDAYQANEFNIQIISELLHHGASYERIPQHKFAQIERDGYHDLLGDLTNPHSTPKPYGVHEVVPHTQQRT